MNVHEIEIRGVRDERERAWLERLWDERWGGREMVTRGRVHHLRDLQALIASHGDRDVGAAVYAIENDEWELVSLDALEPGRGIGTALIAYVEQLAADAGCFRVWLITTNDNLDALRFYQRRGYRIAAIHSGAVDQARTSKPSIPETGFYGIPIHDEIELEKRLT